MKNQQGPSLIVGIIIAAALVIGPGLALSGYVSSSVTPVNPNLEIDTWRAAFTNSLGWCAGIAALFTAVWLLLAHGGDGLNTKAGIWYALGGAAILAAALIGWRIPPGIKEGPGLPMVVGAILVLVAYWMATLFMTPDHYCHTPLLGKLLWGRKA